MKLFLLQTVLLLFLFCLFSCENNNEDEECDCNAIENSGNKSFQQYTLTLSIQNPVYGYVNVEKINSIKLKLNGMPFGPFSSEISDTIGKTHFVQNNVQFSSSKRNYLIYIPQKLDTSDILTVKDYSDFLRNSPALSSGSHICEISEIQFKNLNNQWVIIKPQIYQGFDIISDSKKHFIGDFEISYDE